MRTLAQRLDSEGRLVRFEWEPSLDRAQEALGWMLRRGWAEVHALRAVGDQLGLSVAELRVELARLGGGR